MTRQRYRFYFSWTQFAEEAFRIRGSGHQSPVGPIFIAKLDGGDFRQFTEAEQIAPLVDQAYKLIAPPHKERYSDSVEIGVGVMLKVGKDLLEQSGDGPMS